MISIQRQTGWCLKRLSDAKKDYILKCYYLTYNLTLQPCLQICCCGYKYLSYTRSQSQQWSKSGKLVFYIAWFQFTINILWMTWYLHKLKCLIFFQASAYDLATVKGNEQPTYYSRTYTGTLDYIFYTGNCAMKVVFWFTGFSNCIKPKCFFFFFFLPANKFTVQSVLGTLRDCPIPSAHWSSDHFSLFANLRLLKGRKQLESGSSN